MFNMDELNTGISEGSLSNVKEILQTKVVNVNSKDEQGKTALHQTAGISFRVFYKMGTEPLPMGLEKLIRGIENLIVPNQCATEAL